MVFKEAVLGIWSACGEVVLGCLRYFFGGDDFWDDLGDRKKYGIWGRKNTEWRAGKIRNKRVEILVVECSKSWYLPLLLWGLKNFDFEVRECDATIHLSDGRWGAIEIKLGGDEASVEAGAKSLKKFVSNVDTEVMREPAFLMVVTAKGGYAYRREDGVLVVPVGCLRD